MLERLVPAIRPQAGSPHPLRESCDIFGIFYSLFLVLKHSFNILGDSYRTQLSSAMDVIAFSLPVFTHYPRNVSQRFPHARSESVKNKSTQQHSNARVAAKELAGAFNFTLKAFTTCLSRKGGAASTTADTAASAMPAAAHAGSMTGDGDGTIPPAEKSLGKKARKKRKVAEMAAATAARMAGQISAGAAERRQAGEREDEDGENTRHLSVGFLCAFMHSGQPNIPLCLSILRAAQLELASRALTCSRNRGFSQPEHRRIESRISYVC